MLTVLSASLMLGTLIACIRPEPLGDIWFATFCWTACVLFLLMTTLSVMRLHQLFKQGGKVVAQMLGGRRLMWKESTFMERRLMNLVAETALAAGIVAPTVYVLDKDNSINAFVAGLKTNDAVIGITNGALLCLNRDELHALVAHEFSHIVHGDMHLNMKLSAYLCGLHSLASAGRYFLFGYDEKADEYRRNKNVDNHLFDNAVSVILPLLPFQIIGMVLLLVGSVGSIGATWIQAAVSRKRELLADMAAVQYTRQSQPLINVLCKIAQENSHLLHAHYATEFAHMLFGDLSGSLNTRLIATHPPLIERIANLDAQEAKRLADDIAEWESVLVYQQGKYRYHAVFQAAFTDVIVQNSRDEQSYRQHQTQIENKIKQYRSPAALIAPLPKTWENTQYDHEAANIGLSILLQIEADFQAASGSDKAIRLRQSPPKQALYALEALLPAFVMQPQSDWQNLCQTWFMQIKDHHAALLWRVMAAYLDLTLPESQPIDKESAWQILSQPEMVSLQQLDAALANAQNWDERSKTECLRIQSAKLSGNHMVLWRYLCLRLQRPHWAVGGVA
ncbi:MAG: M48 family metalloprotease [Alysiella sp.]|uniref:M48 family metalloprotease n=1 Tax=Alysiella sp. TaxID=1872483 RepID=UPI0026DC0FF8|nr:M48 family metalloprotease [Alysiella sp.]MDO4433945.1 M48 family metalloprotease [Alysiella sp.]